MPEYVMPGKENADFQALGAFTQGYIEAMLWTEEERLAEESENLESSGVAFTRESGKLETVHIPGNISFDLIAPEALESIKADCQKFQRDNDDLLEWSACYDNGDYEDSQAGHDFWLTRNKHGAGFWDRGLGEIGEKLTEAAQSCGEKHVYLGDDNLIYMD